MASDAAHIPASMLRRNSVSHMETIHRSPALSEPAMRDLPGIYGSKSARLRAVLRTEAEGRIRERAQC